MPIPLTTDELTTLLTTAFENAQIAIQDDGAKHVGHAGNGGGGHYTLQIVWEGFTGHNRVARQRKVHEALAEPLRAGRIHALALTLRTPSEAA
jgi:BolA protein